MNVGNIKLFHFTKSSSNSDFLKTAANFKQIYAFRNKADVSPVDRLVSDQTLQPDCNFLIFLPHQLSRCFNND